MPKRKCIVCGEAIENDDCVPYKNRYAHTRCFNVEMKVLTSEKNKEVKKAADKKTTKGKKTETVKPKVELKDYTSEEDYQKKKQFYDKLRSLLGEDLPKEVYPIVDRHITRYGYSFEGMTNTLEYMILKEMDLTGNIVGLIPYYYGEAEKYFKELDRISTEASKVDYKGMYKERVIKIKPKKRVIKQLDFD